VTDDMGSLRFLAHRKIAKETFNAMHILPYNVFDTVDWEIVHKTLTKVPKLFQLWASKQVMGTTGTMEWDKTVVRKCPAVCKYGTHVQMCYSAVTQDEWKPCYTP
jgi:hypothetical protein